MVNDSSGMEHHPSQCAAVAEFEKLRKEMLEQLVLYQRKLMALQMPCQPIQSAQSTSNKKKIKNSYTKLTYPGNQYPTIGQGKWQKIADKSVSFDKKLFPYKSTNKSNVKRKKILPERTKHCCSPETVLSQGQVEKSTCKSMKCGCDLKIKNLNSDKWHEAYTCVKTNHYENTYNMNTPNNYKALGHFLENPYTSFTRDIR